MLRLEKINLAFGDRILFDDLDWVIQDKKRAALIGPNGSGKTTLLNIITSTVKPDTGLIEMPKNYSIGYLPQEEILLEESSVLQSALKGKVDLLEMEQRMQALRQKISKSDHSPRELNALGELEQQFELAGGYRFEGKAKATLAGLGFDASDFAKPISQLSGGWRMRVYLARLLLQEPDLLLLDEPTNHLDIPSLEWLENYLQSFDGSIVVVSHDRFFIDRLAEEIYELENARLAKYVGNYRDYEEQKEKRISGQLKRREQQEKERQRQQAFIDRFRYKNTKASSVQSRIKTLEKMQPLEEPGKKGKDLKLRLECGRPSYREVLQMRLVSFRYSDEWILKDLDLSIYRGDKVALVGKNGTGKTTLTRLIVGDFEPEKGDLIRGKGVEIGYYAQHQVDILDLDATVYKEVESSVANTRIPQIRDILGLFGFSGQDVDKKIAVLSGGERARVSLAKILLSPVNFLIMDEPTNHLDIRAKHALELALRQYPGTLLLISHDRYFLDRIVNKVVELEGKKLRFFEGNYSDYLHQKEMQADSGDSKKVKKESKQKELKRAQAEARQAVSKKRQELMQVIQEAEESIERLEHQKQEYEELFSKPDFYKTNDAAEQMKQYNRIKEEIDQAYSMWEKSQDELQSLLEQLQNS